MRAIQVSHTGGPEVLDHVEVPDPEPGPRELLIDVAAAGVNFVDVYHRRGLYDRPLPFVLGSEAGGTVADVGEHVAGVRVGDRVVTVSAKGAYAEPATVAAGDAFPVPGAIDLQTAAAAALQGVTAQYLVRDTYPLRPGNRLLVHAGAGGVGGLLIQMAKLIGAEVFTTVSTEEKAAIARQAGADHVIDYADVDFVEAVRAIAGTDRPLDVVYDGVGRATFRSGLELLRPRGYMVLFGQASGPVDPIDLQVLNENGSLFVTRPSLGHYMGAEGPARAEEVFGWIESGDLDIRVGATYPLAEAADAHRALEGRQTVGKVLLVP